MAESNFEVRMRTFGLPGKLDALDGKKFGGLTLKEVVLNAVNGYHEAGNDNNAVKSFDAADASKEEASASNDLSQSGGLVKIPVCSFQEMWERTMKSTGDISANPN